MSIWQHVNGRTFTRTTCGTASSRDGGPRFPEGEQASTEQITYSVNEMLVVHSSSSATYQYSICGSSVWELWVEDGFGAKTWRLRKGSGPIPGRQGRYSGKLSLTGSVLELTTVTGDVLRFAFTAVGMNAGVLKLATPLLEISGMIVPATKIEPGLLVSL